MNPVIYRAGPNTSAAPRVVCPHNRVFGKANCPNCSFGGVMIMQEICEYLELLIKRERNNKKHSYLANLMEEN